MAKSKKLIRAITGIALAAALSVSTSAAFYSKTAALDEATGSAGGYYTEPRYYYT